MIERTELGSAILLSMTHGKANALGPEFLLALDRALVDADRAGARAVVLTGRGTIFSAGVDLKRLLAEGREFIELLLPALTRCLRTLYTLPRPVIAAINGHAIAGGCIFACACDRRIMARDSGRIGAPELLVGVPFPIVPLDLVRTALAPRIAQEAILTGRTYDPTEALANGMVDELVSAEWLVARAQEVAEELAAIPQANYALTKQRLRRETVASWDRLGNAIDAETIEVWASDEVQSAVRRYVEKTLVRA